MEKNRQKGVSLLITLLVMSALLSIAIGLSGLSIGEIQLARESPSSLVAFYAAESGVEWAMYQDRANGMASQSYSDYNFCLNPSVGICYSVTASGTSPTRSIQSKGSFRNTVRSIESTY